MKTILLVNASWDEEAGVWVATSPDVPGLATEAETTEQLLDKLRVMIPELLPEEDTGGGDGIPFELLTRRIDVAHCAV